MIPILCVLVPVGILLAGCITFCAVIGGYKHPDDWWREGFDPEPSPSAADPVSPPEVVAGGTGSVAGTQPLRSF